MRVLGIITTSSSLWLLCCWLEGCHGFPSFVRRTVQSTTATTSFKLSSSTLEELVSSNQERYDSLFPPPLEYSIPQHTSDGTRSVVYFTHVPSSLQKDSTTTTIADVEEDVMKRIYKNDNKYQEKPLLVFLPGLDGVGVSALSQYESLCEDWDVWRMTIDPSSSAKQPSYLELTNAVTDFLEHDLNDGRDIYLMGESFGGLLTTTVALRCSSIIKGLVLINPATSFEDTSWSNIVPLIQALNNPTADPNNLAYSAVASTILSNALLDEQQWKSITTLIGDNLDINLPSVLMGSLQIVGKQLPPSTLQHRLTSWLPVGAQLMTPKRLKSITTPTIIMTGDQDKLLPVRTHTHCTCINLMFQIYIDHFSLQLIYMFIYIYICIALFQHDCFHLF